MTSPFVHVGGLCNATTFEICLSISIVFEMPLTKLLVSSFKDSAIAMYDRIRASASGHHLVCVRVCVSRPDTHVFQY